MKHLIVIIGILALVACGSGSGSDNDGSDKVAVEVSGKIYNPGSGKPTYTISAVQLNSVSQSQGIRLDTIVENTGQVALANLVCDIEIEDATYDTLEHWTCWQRFSSPSTSGTWGFSSWVEYSEPLPACDISLAIPLDCYTNDPVLDCANPSYEVEYVPYAEGYFEASTMIPELAIGEIFDGWMEYGNDSIDIRPDHLALWTVKTSDGTELARQEYIFDVVP